MAGKRAGKKLAFSAQSISSDLSRRLVERYYREYQSPREVTFIPANPLDQANIPYRGMVAWNHEMLRAGALVPMHHFVREVLVSSGLQNVNSATKSAKYWPFIADRGF